MITTPRLSMRKIAAIILVATGSFLEIYFYHTRFLADGLQWWLSIIIGVALTVFLSVLTIMRRNLAILAIAIPLIVFSIVTTIAGQVSHLSMLQDTRSVSAASEATGQDMASYYREQISALNDEYRGNQERLAADLDVLATWKTNAVTPLRERQREIERLRADYESRLVATSGELSTHESVERVELNIYATIADHTGWGAFAAQIILQAALSVFIALMAPVGIILLTTEEILPAPEPEPVGEEQIPTTVDRWVDISWVNYLRGNDRHLMSKAKVLEFDRRQGNNLSSEEYDRILRLALDRRVVEHNAEGQLVPKVSTSLAKQLLA